MVLIILPAGYVLIIFILVTYESSLKIKLVILFVKAEWFGLLTNIIKALIITRFREFILKYNRTQKGYMQTIQTYTPLLDFFLFLFILLPICTYSVLCNWFQTTRTGLFIFSQILSPTIVKVATNYMETCLQTR